MGNRSSSHSTCGKTTPKNTVALRPCPPSTAVPDVVNDIQAAQTDGLQHAGDDGSVMSVFDTTPMPMAVNYMPQSELGGLLNRLADLESAVLLQQHPPPETILPHAPSIHGLPFARGNHHQIHHGLPTPSSASISTCYNSRSQLFSIAPFSTKPCDTMVTDSDCPYLLLPQLGRQPAVTRSIVHTAILCLGSDQVTTYDVLCLLQLGGVLWLNDNYRVNPFLDRILWFLRQASFEILAPTWWRRFPPHRCHIVLQVLCNVYALKCASEKKRYYRMKKQALHSAQESSSEDSSVSFYDPQSQVESSLSVGSLAVAPAEVSTSEESPSLLSPVIERNVLVLPAPADGRATAPNCENELALMDVQVYAQPIPDTTNIGKRFSKHFPSGLFFGFVKAAYLEKNVAYYVVSYYDGDGEDFELQEIYGAMWIAQQNAHLFKESISCSEDETSLDPMLDTLAVVFDEQTSDEEMVGDSTSDPCLLDAILATTQETVATQDCGGVFSTVDGTEHTPPEPSSAKDLAEDGANISIDSSAVHTYKSDTILRFDFLKLVLTFTYN
jgi:hypothetical protein